MMGPSWRRWLTNTTGTVERLSAPESVGRLSSMTAMLRSPGCTRAMPWARRTVSAQRGQPGVVNTAMVTEREQVASVSAASAEIARRRPRPTATTVSRNACHSRPWGMPANQARGVSPLAAMPTCGSSEGYQGHGGVNGSFGRQRVSTAGWAKRGSDRWTCANETGCNKSSIVMWSPCRDMGFLWCSGHRAHRTSPQGR